MEEDKDGVCVSSDGFGMWNENQKKTKYKKHMENKFWERLQAS